jgi:hypothetical protein
MTNMIAEVVPKDEILKVDVLGRVQTSPERREALLREFEKSGVTGKRFAELHGIKYQTFASWRKKRKRRRKNKRGRARFGSRTAKAPVLALAEVAVVEAANKAPGVQALEVELPGGVRLSVNNSVGAHLAAELIRALGREAARSC